MANFPIHYSNVVAFSLKRKPRYRALQLRARVTPDVVAPPDVIPPTVSNVSPVMGTVLLATQRVSFDVTDNLAEFARVIVAVKFATGVQELVHDGAAFVGHYVTQSSRLQIAGGFRYSILRAGGWQSTPTIRIFPIDGAGNDGS